MLSEDAQKRIISDGQDLLSYSQDVDFKLTKYLNDVKPMIQENHMYIRIASNDFFSVSKDVVSKMISGEYDAGQAYQVFKRFITFDINLYLENLTRYAKTLDSLVKCR